MHSKDIFVVAIFTFVTVMAWIVFDVYHASVSSTVTPVQEKLTTPFNPIFDPKTVSQIHARSGTNQ